MSGVPQQRFQGEQPLLESLPQREAAATHTRLVNRDLLETRDQISGSGSVPLE